MSEYKLKFINNERPPNIKIKRKYDKKPIESEPIIIQCRNIRVSLKDQ